MQPYLLLKFVVLTSSYEELISIKKTRVRMFSFCSNSTYDFVTYTQLKLLCQNVEQMQPIAMLVSACDSNNLRS